MAAPGEMCAPAKKRWAVVATRVIKDGGGPVPFSGEGVIGS